MRSTAVREACAVPANAAARSSVPIATVKGASYAVDSADGSRPSSV
jgi:hypothetical protein